MRKARFILPNAFTSMNFLFGVFSVCWSAGLFDGYSSLDPFRLAAYFVILSVLCDKLDGFAARLVNASSEFGAQFDSLGDLVGFGLAPAFCLFFCYKANAAEWLGQNLALVIVVFSIYVLCAAMRLAKYNAMDSDAYKHYFSGLPSTFAGAINVILLTFAIQHGIFTSANSNLLFVPVIVMLVTGLMMVCPCFLPKLQPRKNKLVNGIQIVLILVVYLCGFLFISPKFSFIPGFLLILCALYIVGGFAMGFVNRAQILAEAGEAKDEQE